MHLSSKLCAMFWFTSLLSVLTLTGVARAVVGPGKVTGDTAVHDPTMCKDNSGTYFVFSTGVGIEIRTSKDRTAWSRIGTVFPSGAPWTDQYTGTSNGPLWAPDCTYLNGQFYVSSRGDDVHYQNGSDRIVQLYYSASKFGSQNSAIFFAKSSTGKPGSFSNLGLVTSTTTANNYNAIDPNLIIDGSAWRLSLGSFWTGIKEMQLSSSTGKLSSNTVTALAQRTANGGAIEASVIFKYGNYFYLFSSWDKCCAGTSSTYNIRVGRSTSATGGFVDQAGVALTNGGGTLVLGSHDSIVGPGGQDLMTDSDGTILVYHYYTSSGSYLGINRLDFSSGWPVVA